MAENDPEGQIEPDDLICERPSVLNGLDVSAFDDPLGLSDCAGGELLEFRIGDPARHPLKFVQLDVRQAVTLGQLIPQGRLSRASGADDEDSLGIGVEREFHIRV